MIIALHPAMPTCTVGFLACSDINVAAVSPDLALLHRA